jgi:hypothetical protein
MHGRNFGGPRQPTAAEERCDRERIRSLAARLRSRLPDAEPKTEDAYALPQAGVWRLPVEFRASSSPTTTPHRVGAAHYAAVATAGGELVAEEPGGDRVGREYVVEIPMSRFWFRLHTPWERRLCLLALLVFCAGACGIVGHVAPLGRQYWLAAAGNDP